MSPAPRYEDVLRQCAALPRADVERLRGALAALLGTSGDRSAASESDESWVLDAVAQELEKRGMPVMRNRRPRTMTALRAALSDLMKFLAQAHPRRAGQRMVLDLGIGLLYDNLIELGVPPTASVMLAQIHRVPALIDRAFPGYAGAGLLRMLVREW